MKCVFCINGQAVSETRDGKAICENCAIKWGMCEICGSMPHTVDAATQKHFEEECFK